MNKTVLPKKIKPTFIVVIVASVLSPVSSVAGEIYGRVAINGSVFANAEVTIQCDGFSDSQITNDNGAYRSSGPSGENQCSISVGNASNSVTVYTSQSRTRVNLELKGNRLFRR